MLNKVFSPSHIGVPAHRRRRYSLFGNNTWAQIDAANIPSFEDFFCDLECDASVYISENHLPSESDSLPTNARLSRLEGYGLRAIEDGVCDATMSQWHVPFAICNLENTAEYAGFETKVFPTLLCRSHFYEMKFDRPLYLQELWTVQGFPHPKVDVCRDCNLVFPVPDLVLDDNGGSTPLSASAQRMMVGNSMHWAQLSPWFLYAVSTTPRSFDAQGKPGSSSSGGADLH